MTKDLFGKTVLVCVTGGIAAYKVCDVVSKLAQRGAAVHVAMTEAATHFIGPVTFQALTNQPVFTSLWQSAAGTPIPHINVAQAADVVLVAPATADILGKLAHGMADDLVSTMLLAVEPRRVLLAPAMNEQMWSHPATQRNCRQVFEDGCEFIGPGEGWQACRSVGAGRMSEPAEIVEAVAKKLAAVEEQAEPKHFAP